MSKEPYYDCSSSTSYIKPANSKLYSAHELELPVIESKSILSAAKFHKSDIIEPYYFKKQKIQSLPPALINLFHYKYDFDDDQSTAKRFKIRKLQGDLGIVTNDISPTDSYDDCAIMSDSEDSLFIDKRFVILAAKTSLSRKLSDDYKVKLDLYSDSDTDRDDSVSVGLSSTTAPNCKVSTISPSDNDLDFKSAFQEKLLNPNVITNKKSRSLSMNLPAPKLTYEKDMFFQDMFQDLNYKYDVNDNYESATVDYLI